MSRDLALKKPSTHYIDCGKQKSHLHHHVYDLVDEVSAHPLFLIALGMGELINDLCHSFIQTMEASCRLNNDTHIKTWYAIITTVITSSK